MSAAPQHAFELEIHTGAESWEIAMRELDRLVSHIEYGETPC